MEVKSIKGKSVGEIKTELAKSISDSFKPTLAIVFLSAVEELEAVCSILNIEGIRIFGATTGGEFIDGEVEEESIAIMLLDMNPAYFAISLLDAENNSTEDIANIISELGIKTFSNPGYIISIAGRFIDGTLLINSMNNKLGKNVSIFGGLAGNLIDGSGTSVFNNKTFSKNGLLSLIIDNDKIDLTGFATSGWKPIATFHTITKSEGHLVSTIDEEPAMDMIAKYLGKSFAADSPEEIIYSKEASPIQLYRDNSPSVLREITYFNSKTRAVYFSGPVPQGTKFRFSLPPDWDIVDKIKSDCLMVKEQKQPEADAVIVFSCSARLLSLGPMINSEIEEIKNTWECPTVGFFCFGEIGRYLEGETEFHNNTCSIVLLKEKI